MGRIESTEVDRVDVITLGMKSIYRKRSIRRVRAIKEHAFGPGMPGKLAFALNGP